MKNKGDRVKVIAGPHTGQRGKIDSFWLEMFCPDGKTVEVELDSGQIIAFAPDELGPDLTAQQEARRAEYNVTQLIAGFPPEED